MSKDGTLPLHQVPGAGNITRIFYTGTVPPRPDDALFVDWVGDTDPGANSVNGDTWLPTNGS